MSVISILDPGEETETYGREAKELHSETEVEESFHEFTDTKQGTFWPAEIILSAYL